MKAFRNSKYLLTSLASFILILGFTNKSFANWSWGLGYHNPPGVTLGVNFMQLWSNWAFEAGLGYLGSSETTSSTDSNTNNNSTTNSQVYAGGDINLKYLFGSGTFRPFLQGGTGTYVSIGNNNNSQNNSNNTGANASLGGGFAGAGFFLMGSSFFVYTSYLTSNHGTFQIGIGFN